MSELVAFPQSSPQFELEDAPAVLQQTPTDVAPHTRYAYTHGVSLLHWNGAWFQEFEESNELLVPMRASCWTLSRTANLLLAGWPWMAMVTAR